MHHNNYNVGAPKYINDILIIEELEFELVTPLFNNNRPDGDYYFVKKVKK